MGDFAKKLLIHSVIGVAIAFCVAWLQGLFRFETLSDLLRILSDGFFVAGAAYLVCGGLIWTYNGGVMDGLTYTIKTGIARIKRDYDTERKSFAEYREEREEKASSPKLVLVVGAILMVIALVFLIAYLNFG